MTNEGREAIPYAMGSQRLRVAIVGAGMISKHHLLGWKKVESADVVAVVDPVAANAERRAEEFGIPTRYRDIDELIAAGGVDAVDIASPRETHEPILRKAVANSIHVLCTKPFMPSLAAAEAFVREFDGRSRVMVNQNFRFRPYYQAMHRWIRDGLVGRISGLTIECRSCGLLRDKNGRYPYIERQPFVRNEKRLMIEEVLIHRIDIARWLGGPLRVVAARTQETCDELIGESEATILFETVESGVPVIVDGNFAAAGYPELSHDRIEIIGAKSRIIMENQILKLIGSQPQEIAYEHPVAYQQSFDETIRHFVECLQTGEPFLTDPTDNLETLRLVESAYESAGEVE